MRKYPGRFGLAAASLACLLVLAACSSGSPTLLHITVAPQTATIDATATQQFTATAFYSDGSSKDATTLATWASSNTNVATITPAGLATAGTTAGTSSISATYLGASATAMLTVKQTLTAIVVNCTPASVSIGLTSNCTATGNPGAVDITTSVAWSSSSPAIATIPASASASPAVATSVAAGSTNISATLGTLASNNFSLTVAVGPVSLKVSPSAPSLPVGGSAQFTAVEVWSDSTTHPPSGTVTFASDTASVLNVLSSGASSALSAGSATVTATEGSLTGNTMVTVTAGVTKFAYISNIGDNDVQWYTVTAANAAPLVSAGTATPTNTSSVQTIVHPSGNFLYSIESGSGAGGQIRVYTVNPTTGQLTDAGLPTPAFGQGNTNFGAIDPYGRFLYVLDSGNPSGIPATLGSLYAFSINPSTGALTPIGSGPITTGLDFPFCVLVDRTGSYVYVTNEGLNSTTNKNTLNAYQIGATGALTPLATANYPTGLTPAFATIDPSGNHIYVANNGDGTVTGYTVNKTTGALTAMTPATITGTANHVLNLVVDPSNKYLYVLDAGDPTTIPVTNGQVFGYVLNADGSIPSAAIAGTPITAGPVPTGMAIDISGTLLAVDNSGSTGAGSISLYTITPSSGALAAKTPATVAAGNVAQLVTFYSAAQ